MQIKVLGPGCRNCVTLAEQARKAVDGLGLDATVEKVTDYGQIAAYGVMFTPALVVDEKLMSVGKVLKAAEIARLLKA